ncbi:MAG: hypothetical protein IVW57_06110, partial [Ktedonobacterales bacterium]|nr:hypothetical protein [Ktedonobacterales bacterium]
LTQCAPSKILISTRLVPLDLLDRAGQPLAGVRVQELGGLKPQDALDMLRGLGVHGDTERMRLFMEQFGYHSLLIEVIAGRINAYRPAPSDFDIWYRDEGSHLRLDDKDLATRRTSILQAALERLEPEVFHFLCQIAAFRYPVDYAALSVLNPYAPSSSGTPLTEEETRRAQAHLNLALAELEERGLLQWDRAANRYDLHPVVRAYAFARLEGEDRQETFGRIRDYFEALPLEDAETVHDVSDLRRTLEVYHALLGAELYDQAFVVYRDRLAVVLYYRLGAYHTIVELLTPFFPQGYTNAPALPMPRRQGYVINELANVFANLGDIEQALVLGELGYRIDLEQQDTRNLATGLYNYADNLLDGGYMAAGVRAAELARAVAEAARDLDKMHVASEYLMRAYGLMGDRARGEAMYQAIMGAQWATTASFVMVDYAELLMGQGEDATALLGHAWERSLQGHNIFTMRRTRELQGEVALERGQLEEAQRFWLEALELAHRSGVLLAPFHANLARLRAAQGRVDEARQLIEQAFTDGQPTLAAAEVYLALGETATARAYALRAYKRAWADGPPYIYARDLRRTRAVLAALGEPEPTLPPYNPARVRPLPQEAEIRAFIAELGQRAVATPARPSTGRPHIANRVDSLTDPWHMERAPDTDDTDEVPASQRQPRSRLPWGRGR